MFGDSKLKVGNSSPVAGFLFVFGFEPLLSLQEFTAISY